MASRSLVVHAADGTAVAPGQFHLLRVDDESERDRSNKEELDVVRSLEGTVHSSGISIKKMGGVHEMEAKRKHRHDEQIRSFEILQRSFYGELEDAVLSHGRTLRSSLSGVENRLEAVFTHIGDEAIGVLQDIHWLHRNFNELERLEDERRDHISNFARNLEHVEDERVRVLGERMEKLTSALVDIGYELEPAIDRLVEKIAVELNVVVISNRKDHADVIARLESKAVLSRQKMHERRDAADRAWRLLKHKDAVQRYQDLLNSPLYKNPPARVRALELMSEGMKKRHLNNRLPLLRSFLSLRPPQLSEDADAPITKEGVIESYKVELDHVEKQDQMETSTTFSNVRNIQEEVITTARERAENLRLELHGYEALVPEGRLHELGAQLESFIKEPSLEEFFRKAGGLKVELEQLCDNAKKGDIIYEGPISNLRDRLTLLVDAFSVGPALEKVGKAVERTALLGILDQLRSAKRSDVPGLVVKLHRLISSTLRVQGLPQTVITEFESVIENLGDLIEEINDSLVAANVEVPQPILKFLFPDRFTSSGASTVGNGSVTGSTIGGGMSVLGSDAGSIGRSMAGGQVTATGRSRSRAARSSSPGREGSGNSGGSRGKSADSNGGKSKKSGKSRAGSKAGSKRTRRTAGMKSQHTSILSEMTDAMSSVMGQVLPMPAIRALQRRIAVIAAASDLPEDAKTLTKTMLAACNIQSLANATVDGVISNEALPLISSREKESQSLLKRIGAALDKQAARLRDGGVRTCEFLREIARAVHAHAKEQKVTDDEIADNLNGCIDEYVDNAEKLENAFLELEKPVREAPHLKALSDRFNAANKGLDDIENNYRLYADNVLNWTKLHPKRTNSALRVHRKALCALFGLSFPEALTCDGAPILGEELPYAISWTIDGPKITNKGKLLLEELGVKVDDSLVATQTLDEDDVREPDLSVLIPLRDQVAAGGITLDPSESPHLEIAAASIVHISHRVGGDLAALNLASAIIPSPAPHGSARYDVVISPSTLSYFLCDADGLLAAGNEAAAKKRAENEAAEKEAKRLADEAAVKAAAAAAAAAPPAKGAKEVKKSKAELEAEAKAAAEAEARKAKEKAEAEAKEKAEEEARLARAKAEEEAKMELLKMFPFGMEDQVTGMPLDIEGRLCVPLIAFPRDEISSLLTSLRNDLLSHFEQYAEERRQVMAELATARSAAYTAELEERLRRHWPRKGVLEVSVRAPREAELIDHRLRVDRLMRVVSEKRAQIDLTCEAWLTEQREYIENTSTKVKGLQAGLASQVNLAGLQGLQQRARQLRGTYQSECAAFISAERSRLVNVSAKNLASLDDLLKSCVLFSAGGRYDPEEVAIYTLDVDKLREASVVSDKARDEAVTKIETEQAASLSVFDEFFKEFEVVLKEVSMREGLGPKFGAPRRRVINAVRSAITKSEEAADAIDGRLDELRALLSAKPGSLNVSVINDDGSSAVRGVPTANSSGAEEEELQILRLGKGLHESVAVPPAPTSASAPAPGGKGAAAAPPAKEDPKKAAAAAPAGSKPGTAAAAAPPINAHQMSPETQAALESAKARELDMKMLNSDVGTAKLSTRIRRCVLVLRDLLYSRALHLDALKTQPDMHGPLRSLHLPHLSLSDVPPACSIFSPDSDSIPALGAPVSVTLPAVHIPAAFPLLSEPKSLVFPASALPPQDKQNPSPLFEFEAWIKINGLGNDGCPHTIKGPLPSPIVFSAKEQLPFVKVISQALENCRQETRVLYKEEGVTLKDGEEGLPESLRKWLAEQTRKSLELREFSARRLRLQAAALGELLPHVPQVLAADILARSMAEVDSDSQRRLRYFRSSAQALEEVRVNLVSQLRLGLSDPNNASALLELVNAEARRTQELRELLRVSRAVAVGVRARHARVFFARLVHSTALFLLASEECIVPEDFAPLPGDELVVPQKLGFKRLHKTLRRAGDESHAVADIVLGADDDTAAAAADAAKKSTVAAPTPAAASATAAKGAKPGAATSAPAAALAPPPVVITKAARNVFELRNWHGVDHPDSLFTLDPQTDAAGLVLINPLSVAAAPLPDPKSPRPITPSKTSPAAATATTSTSPGGTAGASAAPTSGKIGAVSCTYASWSRHAILERDGAIDAYLQNFRASVSAVAGKFDAARDEVDLWEKAWTLRVNALKATNSAKAQEYRIHGSEEKLEEEAKSIVMPDSRPSTVASSVAPSVAASKASSKK
jgi:hypothetical protein